MIIKWAVIAYVWCLVVQMMVLSFILRKWRGTYLASKWIDEAIWDARDQVKNIKQWH